jgi:hypothetical protein
MTPYRLDADQVCEIDSEETHRVMISATRHCIDFILDDLLPQSNGGSEAGVGAR